MTYAAQASRGLEYYPCRYGRSRVFFRGPRRSLDGRYVAFLGTTDTYGLFVPAPFPVLAERQLSVPCVNLGAKNAGVDLYLNDPEVLNTAQRADAVVLQVMGAQNMCNRYYAVHPRRNDRFLRASEALLALFPEVDFTDFSFNRHMLGTLQALDPDRFSEIAEELRMAWLARMKHLLSLLRRPVVLFWLGRQGPFEHIDLSDGHDPLLITQGMINALTPRVSQVCIAVASPRAVGRGTRGMVYTEFEKPAAKALLGPLAHQEAADALVPTLRTLLQQSHD